MRDYHIPMLYPAVDTTGRQVPVSGGTIHVRIYTPPAAAVVRIRASSTTTAAAGLLPTLTPTTPRAGPWPEQVGAVVVSVAYRRAPEYKFPTAHNDSFAAYQWTLANAASIKIDPARVAVAGESAGGNLAAAVCMMARSAGAPLPRHQLLVYPIAGYDFTTPSYQQYADAKPLNKPLMMWFFDKYLTSPADGQNPLISLVTAPNLAGLPSATVINAELDPLQSEGQAYAGKLQAAGVAVTAKVYPGVTHEFFGMAAVLPEAQAAQALASSELKNAAEIIVWR